MKQQDSIYPLLRFSESLTFSALPSQVVEICKRFILDTLATTVAGTQAPGCSDVINQLRDWGGKPEAFVVGTKIKLPSNNAALANSMMAHALDFDDVHEPADVHANAVVLPAVMAAAEIKEDVSGQEFITAVVIGVDIMCRIGFALKEHRGWHPTATCGIFGATAAAGRVLGLKGDVLHNALGIAYSLASGNWQCILDAALTKRLQPGFAAGGAMMAVALAKRGITGSKNILEGKAGFYQLYERGEYDPAVITRDLGRHFEVEGLSMKPYASIRYCHSAVDAVLELCEENDITADDVESMDIEMPIEGYDYSGGEFEPGDSPQVSAQFNAAYNAAAAMIDRKVCLDHFKPETVLNPKYMAVAGRVNTFSNDDSAPFGPVTVTIKMNNGSSFARRITVMKGHPDNPMTEAECLAKVKDCLSYAKWPAKKVARIEQWTMGLDQAEKPMTELSSLLSERREENNDSGT